jgi:S1-C subfamily serine protease
VGDVIRAVNGKAVTGPQDWIKMISECEPGTKVELKVVRERKEWRVICDVAEAKRQ